MTTLACAGEESGEDVQEDELQDSFSDDEAADVEAAQLLQGLRSQDRVLTYSDAGTPQAVAAAAAPLPRKRGRPPGSKASQKILWSGS